MTPFTAGLIHFTSEYNELLTIGGAVGGATIAWWLRRLWRKRISPKKGPQNPTILTPSGKVLGVVLLTLVLGAVFLVSLGILGLGWEMLGLVALAVTCTLASIALLVLAAILIYTLINPISGGGRDAFGNSCGLILLTIFVFIPGGALAGGALHLLFLSLFLGIAIPFGTAVVLFLVNAALILLGVYLISLLFAD